MIGRTLTEDFFQRGLPARFLFAYPPPPEHGDPWTEQIIPEQLRKAVLETFQELYLLQPGRADDYPCPILLPLEKAAKAEYIAFYNACGETAVESSDHEAYAWSKLRGYCARLALVGQLLRDPHSEQVTGETMQSACDLARWSGNEAVRIYAALRETPEQREQRKLIEFIERRGGSVTVRDVMQSFTRLKNDREATERELTNLVKAGCGEWKPVPTTAKGGKPTRKFRLLLPSTSTIPPNSRWETEGSVDVDTYKGEKITLVEQPKINPDSAKESDSEPADVSSEVAALVSQHPEGETLI